MAHPQQLSSINPSLLSRIESLVTDVKFNLDEELSDDQGSMDEDNVGLGR